MALSRILRRERLHKMHFYAKFLFFGKNGSIYKADGALAERAYNLITILIIGDGAICQSAIGPGEASVRILSDFYHFRLIHLNT